LRTAGGGRASEAVTGGGVSMTQGGPLTAWICLALLECMTCNPVYRIGGMAEAIAGAGTRVPHAGNDDSSPSTASLQEVLPWGLPNVPRHPRVIGMVAMVDLAIVDLTAFCLEFIRRDRDEPIPPPRAEFQLAAAPS